MQRFIVMSILAFALLTDSLASAAPLPVATWEFNNTLSANEPSAPALTAIDPLGRNNFIRDTVFGVSRTVYRYNGNQTPAEQAGLFVSAKGLFNEGDPYSVEMIFQFENNQSSWKSIFGISNRQSDNAFYVEPGNKLQVYPNHGGPTDFTFGQYHHVTLTNDGRGHVTSYLDGVFQFDLTTDIMSFASYKGVNPDRLIHFFVDNTVGGGQGEYVNGRVALIRLYASELARAEVNRLGAPPSKEDVVLMPVRGTDLVANDIANCEAAKKNQNKPEMSFEEYKKREYKDFDAFKKGAPSTREVEQRQEAAALSQRIKEENKRLKTTLGGLIAEGLSDRYTVVFDDTECDAIDCMKNVAHAHDAKLIAAAFILKQDNNYALKLIIQNFDENKVVYSKTSAAMKCNADQLATKFREISKLPKP